MAKTSSQPPSFLVKFYSRHRTNLAIAAILLIAISTRFFKLASLFHWTMDEEFWSYIPHNIATGYHVPLIGGHISGTGLYSGPLFVWLLAPFFCLIQSHPIGIALLVSSVGVLTTYLIYKSVTSNFSLKTALLASLLYASSTLTTIYDRKYWNAFPIPILSLLTIFFLDRLNKNPDFLTVFFLSLTLTLAFHAHMTGAVLLIFVFITWFLHRLPKKQFFNLLAPFFIFQAPLYIFELRHHFINSRALLNLITSSSGSPFSLSAFFEAAALTINTFARLVYMPAIDIARELTLCSLMAGTRSLPNTCFKLMALIILVRAVKLARKRNLFALLLIINIILVFFYRLIAPAGSWYPGQLSEYYFLPSYAAFIVIAANLLISSYNKKSTFVSTIVIFLIVINLHTTFNLTHSDSFAKKQTLVNSAISHIDHQPFSLDITGHPCKIYGFRYLFSLYDQEPVSSYIDPQFLWLYQRRLPTSLPTKHITIDTNSATIDVTDVSSTPGSQTN